MGVANILGWEEFIKRLGPHNERPQAGHKAGAGRQRAEHPAITATHLEGK